MPTEMHLVVFQEHQDIFNSRPAITIAQGRVSESINQLEYAIPAQFLITIPAQFFLQLVTQTPDDCWQCLRGP